MCGAQLASGVEGHATYSVELEVSVWINQINGEGKHRQRSVPASCPSSVFHLHVLQKSGRKGAKRAGCFLFILQHRCRTTEIFIVRSEFHFKFVFFSSSVPFPLPAPRSLPCHLSRCLMWALWSASKRYRMKELESIFITQLYNKFSLDQISDKSYHRKARRNPGGTFEQRGAPESLRSPSWLVWSCRSIFENCSSLYQHVPSNTLAFLETCGIVSGVRTHQCLEYRSIRFGDTGSILRNTGWIFRE